MKTVKEILGLTVAALVLGLGWNSFSENGISIDKKHVRNIPKNTDAPESSDPQSGNSTTGSNSESPNGTTTNSNGDTADGKRSYDDPQSWSVDGVQFCNIDKAVEFYDFGDEAFFIDARKAEEYAEGHIPTAFSVNNYQADKIVPKIFDSLMERPFLVVYCGGGDCEDSIYLATALAEEFDFDPELVYVYKGGMTEWQEHELPVQVGTERGELVPR